MCGPFPTFRADDARCDWQCNNLACAHNDCTSSQAIDKCIPEHDAAGFDHSVPPRIIGSSSKLVPLTLTMTLPVLKPVLNAEVNQQVLSLDIGHSLTWTSPDLWRSPCVLHTPGVISMSRSEGNSDMARNSRNQMARRFWTPQIDAQDMLPGYDAWPEETVFTYQVPGVPADATSQQIAITTDPEARQTLEATFSGETPIIVTQKFNYFYYPFDTQIFQIALKVDGSNITNCEDSGNGLLDQAYPLANMALTLADVQEKLLGAEGTSIWRLDPTKGAHAVTSAHPVGANGNPALDVCEVKIYLRRNYVVYLTKYMMMTVMVVIGSILTANSLYAEDHTGDRCAVLFIAFLILVTSMQTDLGLGELTYLIWLDWFNLTQLAMVCLSVGSTMLVHRLQKHQRDSLAKHIDIVNDFAMPFVLYPIITMGMILEGVADILPGSNDVSFILLVVGFPAAIVGIVVRVWYNLSRLERQQSIAISIYRKAFRMGAQDFSAESLKKAATAAFTIFDIDGSGEMDAKEMRDLVAKAYYDCPEREINRALLEARVFADADGRYDVGNFIDAVQHLNQYMQQFLPAEVSEDSKKLKRGNTRASSRADPWPGLEPSSLVPSPAKETLRQSNGHANGGTIREATSQVRDDVAKLVQEALLANSEMMSRAMGELGNVLSDTMQRETTEIRDAVQDIRELLAQQQMQGAKVPLPRPSPLSHPYVYPPPRTRLAGAPELISPGADVTMSTSHC